MIILAVYYTLADIVLLGQCFYYRGFTLSDNVVVKKAKYAPAAGSAGGVEEEEGLLPSEHSALLGNGRANGRHESPDRPLLSRDDSHHHYSHVDGTHLSPATPFIDDDPEDDTTRPARRVSTLQTVVFNLFAIALVCAAGVLGWYISERATQSSRKHHEKDLDDNAPPLTFDLWGQIFGYFCAVLYLGSRVPQLLLNYRRKSTEGVSLLFFLFACIGNLTYVLSIFAYSPVCGSRLEHAHAVGPLEKHRPVCQPGEAASIYGRYILVNLSWILGSLGTLLLDMAIFVQFFLYSKDDFEEDDTYDDDEGDSEYERR
jgi:hypothetical protein